jgi:hypothetical protein
MTRFLTTIAFSALMLGAAAPGWAQSSPPPMSYDGCHRSDGNIADCLNRGVVDRNNAANAVNSAATSYYGSSGVTPYAVAPAAPSTTTTTTTYSRTIYPPPYPGAYR